MHVMLDTFHPQLRQASSGVFHHDARFEAWWLHERLCMPSRPPIVLGERAGRRHREGHQCQPALGPLQAELVLWRAAANTEELDGRAAVDEGGGLLERADV
jgi:hypothetical protein